MSVVGYRYNELHIFIMRIRIQNDAVTVNMDSKEERMEHIMSVPRKDGIEPQSIYLNNSIQCDH